MRVISPAPMVPPSALTRKLPESPTPWMYLATCTTVPSASTSEDSCSLASRAVSVVLRPSRLTNSLKTLVVGPAVSSPVSDPGPFQVPSAQKMMVFAMVASRFDALAQP